MAKETFSSLINLFKNSSSSSVSTLVCDACGNKLSLFKIKKPCVECRRQFCAQCLRRCRDRALRCKNCCILTTRPLQRSELLDLRVKDLQHYLNQHNVSTRGCLEKEDLVNVLLRYAATSGNHPTGQAGNAPGQSRNPPTAPSRSSAPRSTGTSTGIRISTHVESSHPPQSSYSPSAPPSATGTEREIIPPSQTGSGHGESDSSSDTSFEMVQRPSSEENITSVHSSSSSSSVLGATSQSKSSHSLSHSTEHEAVSPVVEATSSESGAVDGNPSSNSSHSPSVENNDLTAETSAVPAGDEIRSADIPEVVVESNDQHSESRQSMTQNISPSVSLPTSSNNSPNLLRGTMASISSEADFESLSVKQLKDILLRHRVNYFGCCEKAELVEKAKRLYRDYCSSRAELEKLDMDALCKICMDAPVECVMLECGHMATCTDCGRQLSECPICRQFVVRIVRTFKA